MAGIAAVTGAAVVGARPALADHRLAPAAHRLDTATEALLDALVGTAHHQEEGNDHEANDELLAVMAAGALQGQAHAVHELIEAGNPDANVLLAARELDRQMRIAQQRILHAHTTQGVRIRFRSVRAAMDDFLSQAGARGYGRDPHDRFDRNDRFDPRFRDRNDQDDDHSDHHHDR
jgi:hypothetical protein